MGFGVGESTPASEVLERATELARDLAINTAPLSVGVSKRLLWMSAPTPEEINTLERELHLPSDGYCRFHRRRNVIHGKTRSQLDLEDLPKLAGVAQMTSAPSDEFRFG